MTHDEQTVIDQIVTREVEKIRATKGREYATDEDTLADFKEVAENAGVTPFQCWLIYVEKHQRAIATFVREGEVRSEAIESRVLDVIVYHHLFLGLLAEHPHHSGFIFGKNPFGQPIPEDEVPEQLRATSPAAKPLTGPQLDASVPFPHTD
jgi:hypothetical protein